METQEAVWGSQKREREEEEEEPLRRGQPQPRHDVDDDDVDEEKAASEKADDVDDDDKMKMVMTKLRELELGLPPPPPSKPLPEGECNWPDNIWTGNHMLLFDDYPTGIGFEQLIHPKFRDKIERQMVVNGESSPYAFFEFNRNVIAEAFLNHFNGEQIPGTNLKYHLSWAPFVYGPPCDPWIYTSDETPSEVENRRIAWASYWNSLFEKREREEKEEWNSLFEKREREEEEEEEEEDEDEDDGDDSMPEQGRSCSAEPTSYPVGLEQSYNMNDKRDKWWTEHLDLALPEGDDEPEVIVTHQRPFESAIIFLGGLDSKVTEEDLNHIFEPLAPAKVKIYARRNCGYMEFHTMDDARKAIKCLNRFWVKRKICQPLWGKKRGRRVPDMLENESRMPMSK